MISNLLDQAFGLFMKRYPFFHQGWGESDLIEKIRTTHLEQKPTQKIEIHWTSIQEDSKMILKEGIFKSPFQDPAFPEESRYAYIQLLLPKGKEHPPVCIHFAATSDQGFKRRRKVLAIPLLKKGIGSLILENPYYGRRRPKNQKGFRLNRFTDLWAMTTAAVEEGKSLVGWLKENGFNSIGVTGMSMGGYVSAIVASQVKEPIAVIPCIAPHSAAPVFQEGVLKNGCDWKALQEELEKENAKELMKALLELSDIRHYPPLSYPEAAIMVAGEKDKVVPFHSCQTMHKHWKGSHFRSIKTTHIGSYFFHAKKFVQAIEDAFKYLEENKSS